MKKTKKTQDHPSEPTEDGAPDVEGTSPQSASPIESSTRFLQERWQEAREKKKAEDTEKARLAEAQRRQAVERVRYSAD